MQRPATASSAGPAGCPAKVRAAHAASATRNGVAEECAVGHRHDSRLLRQRSAATASSGSSLAASDYRRGWTEVNPASAGSTHAAFGAIAIERARLNFPRAIEKRKAAASR